MEEGRYSLIDIADHADDHSRNKQDDIPDEADDHFEDEIQAGISEEFFDGVIFFRFFSVSWHLAHRIPFSKAFSSVYIRE